MMMFFRSSFHIRYIQCLQQKDLEAAKSRRRGGQAKAGRVVVGLWVCYGFGLLRARKNVYIAPYFFHVRHAQHLWTSIKTPCQALGLETFEAPKVLQY